MIEMQLALFAAPVAKQLLCGITMQIFMGWTQ
jgi:hypothetical protein